MPLLTPPPPSTPAELLLTCTVGELLASENIKPVYLSATATVEEGCDCLTERNVSSVPLYDSASDSFIGLLDFRDLATYVLKIFHKTPTENRFSVDAEMGLHDVVKMAQIDKQAVPVHMIANLSKRDSLVSIDSSALLLDACKLLVQEKVHRLVVFSNTVTKGPEKFVGVVSESSINKFVAHAFGKLGGAKKIPGAVWDKGEKPLAELGLVKGNVVSIQKEDSVLDALGIMHDKGISSVAIIEGDDHLIGTISMTDIREILKSRRDWKHLYDRVFNFFQSTISKAGLERGQDRVPSVVVRTQTSLLMTMERMAGTHVHRLWIVENGDRLCGILSLSDIMPQLL
ncbi:hypothetical protein SmJEL517_g00730 [Synchytrium microbalum]|uniref:CBS domain-containing protein n=1 Tax=Synchytrium microbalum TaxID=1806994 RepID=A0A507CET4_9FUNG|nr:uncharacterized protein SmJEL517_g00730 [Synchytrium microbalum]TPX37699.1 hypothetical protein SmJEL517_g00730 [Synchytrium microbalum]